MTAYDQCQLCDSVRFESSPLRLPRRLRALAVQVAQTLRPLMLQLPSLFVPLHELDGGRTNLRLADILTVGVCV